MVLHGGEKINFSIRAFPYAVFHLPTATDAAAAPAAAADADVVSPSGKRQRRGGGAPAAAAVPTSPAAAAAAASAASSQAAGASAGELADLTAAKAALEKQVTKQSKDIQKLHDEAQQAQKGLEQAQQGLARAEVQLQDVTRRKGKARACRARHAVRCLVFSPVRSSEKAPEHDTTVDTRAPLTRSRVSRDG